MVHGKVSGALWRYAAKALRAYLHLCWHEVWCVALLAVHAKQSGIGQFCFYPKRQHERWCDVWLSVWWEALCCRGTGMLQDYGKLNARWMHVLGCAQQADVAVLHGTGLIPLANSIADALIGLVIPYVSKACGAAEIGVVVRCAG